MVCNQFGVPVSGGLLFAFASQSPPEGGTPNLFAFAPCYLSLPSILQTHEFGP